MIGLGSDKNNFTVLNPTYLFYTQFGKSENDIKVSLPFFACPTAGNRMFHTEGELATAKVKT